MVQCKAEQYPIYNVSHRYFEKGGKAKADTYFFADKDRSGGVSLGDAVLHARDISNPDTYFFLDEATKDNLSFFQRMFGINLDDLERQCFPFSERIAPKLPAYTRSHRTQGYSSIEKAGSQIKLTSVMGAFNLIVGGQIENRLSIAALQISCNPNVAAKQVEQGVEMDAICAIMKKAGIF